MAVSKLDEVVSLAKRRGFVFPAGEIYGGTRSAWDYGPLGVALKDNIKREWWRSMVVTRGDVVGVDTSIILPPAVWVASGHVSVFNDPLIECLNCHKRHRADKLEESYAEKHGDKLPENGLKDIVCPDCGTRGNWTELPASGNRTGHFRGLQERDDFFAFQAAVRHRQHGQVLP